MSETALFIGVDIGTTGVRSVVYQPDGTALATAAEEYPLHTDQSGAAEQDPDMLLAAMERVIQKTVQDIGAAATQVKGLCFSTVLHSLVCLDEAGKPLMPMMTWADTRGQMIKEELKNHINMQAVYARTCCPLHPMYPLLKVYWLKKYRPEIFAKTACFGSIKDYLMERLTGQRLVDRSIASGSGLYDCFKGDWDEELLGVLDISPQQMVPVRPTTDAVPLLPEAAKRLGLPAAAVAVLGAGDGMMANVGVGAVKPGQINITIGTSGAVRMVCEQPKNDEKGRTWCYNLTEKHWMIGGAITNGGIAFRWMRDKFSETEQRVAEKLGLDSYALLSHYAEKVPAGSDGLILLPFFAGERAPYWNADARGVLFGLTLNHDKRHMIRATLEGICYRIKSILDALEEVTGEAKEIRLSGSFTRSNLWMQILADVLGRKISLPKVEEGAAFGAALLGFYALGLVDSVEVAADMVGIQKVFEPNPTDSQTYAELYPIYLAAYWGLQEPFKEIAAYQRSRELLV